MCGHSPEGQPYSGLHPQQYGQPGKAGGSAPLLRSGETPLGVLQPALEPSAQQRHGAGTEEATEMVQGMDHLS